MQSLVEPGDALSTGRAAVLRLGELESALSDEQVLLEDLGQVLLRQRVGVAADDPEVVEATGHALSRTLLTLEDGIPLPAAFIEAGESVRRAGEAIAVDVAINQDVLTRSLEAGEAFRQQLFSGGGQ